MLATKLVEKRLDRLKKGKATDPQSKMKEEAEKSAVEIIEHALMDGKPARSVSLTNFEKDDIRHLCLLTMKPIIYVTNVAESDLADPGSNSHVKEVMNLASELQSGIVTISAQAEHTELPPEEMIEYLTSLGVNESGLGNLIKATYSLLGLRTYFTYDEKETKAWIIRSGMTAPQAAGVIHSDFERGFIRAETVMVINKNTRGLYLEQAQVTPWNGKCLLMHDDYVLKSCTWFHFHVSQSFQV
ncbi:hypothetical protein ACS0TY_006786 [Phlomoides rotata]